MLHFNKIKLSDSYTLGRWPLVLFLVAGSLIRLYYGIESTVWNRAHDQIAWELPLHELYQTGKFSIKQLINYPHEGGTFFLSLLSLLYLPLLKSFPVLSITAFLIDLASRAIQIVIARKIFGDTTAFFFAIWTVISVPLMLPWGLAFFGLHNSSVWLFLFVYLMFSKPLAPNRSLLIGLFTGFAISFTYHNIILFPAFCLVVLFKGTQDRIKILTLFTNGAVLALLPHLFMRFFCDLGFPFEENTILSAGRPAAGDLNLGNDIFKFFRSLFVHLPDAINLPSANFVQPLWFQVLFFVLIIVGILNCIFSRFSKRKERSLLLVLTLLYIFVFAISSMYTEQISDGFFYSYRHFAFILPIVFLFIIDSIIQLKQKGQAVVFLVLLLCLSLEINFLRFNLIKVSPDYKVAGWIITRKYGNEVPKLKSLWRMADTARQNELLYGYGWGLTLHNLYQKEPESSEAKRLNFVFQQFPHADTTILFQGQTFAFNPGVTPTLNPEFRSLIIEERNKNSNKQP